MARKIKLDTRSNKEWKKLIKSCLYKSAHTSRWGCLGAKGNLFRIVTLDSIQVPMHIIHSMEKKGVLKLKREVGNSYMYSYIPNKKHKKRKKRALL